MSTVFELWQDATSALKPEDIPELALFVPYQQLHSSIVPVPEANIATDLGPKLDPLLSTGSRVSVVGHDGGAIISKGYSWAPFLRKLLEKGVSVDYLLSAECVSPETTSRFAGLAAGLRPEHGRLRLFRANPDGATVWKNCLRELQTFHFVVTESPRTLWLETNHPTSEPKAFNCYFFPEDAATATGLGAEYQARFDGLIAHASVQIPL